MSTECEESLRSQGLRCAWCAVTTPLRGVPYRCDDSAGYDDACCVVIGVSPASSLSVLPGVIDGIVADETPIPGWGRMHPPAPLSTTCAQPYPQPVDNSSLWITQVVEPRPWRSSHRILTGLRPRRRRRPDPGRLGRSRAVTGHDSQPRFTVTSQTPTAAPPHAARTAASRSPAPRSPRTCG